MVISRIGWATGCVVYCMRAGDTTTRPRRSGQWRRLDGKLRPAQARDHKKGRSGTAQRNRFGQIPTNPTGSHPYCTATEPLLNWGNASLNRKRCRDCAGSTRPVHNLAAANKPVEPDAAPAETMA